MKVKYGVLIIFMYLSHVHGLLNLYIPPHGTKYVDTDNKVAVEVEENIALMQQLLN